MPESRPRKFSATRSPVRIARSEPVTRATTAGGSDDVAVARERLEADVRVERAERRLGDAEAADDAGLLDEELGRADGVRRRRSPRS